MDSICFDAWIADERISVRSSGPAARRSAAIAEFASGPIAPDNLAAGGMNSGDPTYKTDATGSHHHDLLTASYKIAAKQGHRPAPLE